MRLRGDTLLKPPIEPMRAVGVAELPEPRMCRGGCAYEPKFDGWRCTAFIGTGRVYLQSRYGKNLTPYFPDAVRHLAATLPPDTVVDGELICWSTTAGRTSFSALQGRITAGRRLADEVAVRPVSLVVFDLLEHAGRVLLDEPLHARRAVLESVLAAGPTALPICPQTLDVELARQWFDELGSAGSEGLLVKDLAGRYRTSGRGSTSWWKYKRRVSAEALIGGVLGTAANPRALLLARWDQKGQLRYVGRSGALTVAQRAQVAAALAVTEHHPWPHPLPAAWSGQFDRREPQDYLRVEPVLVAEIVVDGAYEHGRWRHPVRHIRLRADLEAGDVPRWVWDSFDT